MVVAPVITDENGTETFDSFLLVELDKNGNATLLNHEVQKRTLHAMTIVTNEYKFDIANEKLYWGESEIDLKKVGGSSNEYKEVVKRRTADRTLQQHRHLLLHQLRIIHKSIFRTFQVIQVVVVLIVKNQNTQDKLIKFTRLKRGQSIDHSMSMSVIRYLILKTNILQFT